MYITNVNIQLSRTIMLRSKTGEAGILRYTGRGFEHLLGFYPGATEFHYFPYDGYTAKGVYSPFPLRSIYDNTVLIRKGTSMHITV